MRLSCVGMRFGLSRKGHAVGLEVLELCIAGEVALLLLYWRSSCSKWLPCTGGTRADCMPLAGLMDELKGRKMKESSVKVAAIQMEPQVGHKDENVRKSLACINDAADAGANLVVLPELCNSGYVFTTRAEAFELAEPVPDGPTCREWARVAAERGLYIIAGISERVEQELFNAAVLIGPQGHIGTYRKVHLWNEEHLHFEPGNLGFPVFTTPLGRIGMCICYDIWFPEAFRTCALRGADIVCVPTNWVPIPGQAANREAMANILIMGAAHTNSMYVAAADRVGTERGQPFIGCSLIASYTGWPIAGPASPDQEEILYAEVNLSDARRARSWNDYNVVLRDRRNDSYSL